MLRPYFQAAGAKELDRSQLEGGYMNVRRGFASVWQAILGGLRRPAAAGATGEMAGASGVNGMAGSIWRGLSGRSLELAEVQEEVAAETRGQVLMIGPHDEANRGLLARLRGQAPVPPAGPVYREGFFSVVALPMEPAEGVEAGRVGLDGLAETLPLSEVMGLVSEADVLLYVFAGAQGWRASDARWYARLRATGTPLILVEADLPMPPDNLAAESAAESPGMRAAQQATLPAGDRPVTVCLATPVQEICGTPPDVIALVDRILAQRQRLAIPLAQEIRGCRPMIAGRAIRSGMLMAALLGAEPIPLLDLPLQVAVNWRMALQLAAIYGHPGLDYRSREMIGTVAWNLGLRYLIQQALKFIPLLGWAASAGLSGLGAWLFGNALLRHFQDEGRWRVTQGRLHRATEAARVKARSSRTRVWGWRTRWAGRLGRTPTRPEGRDTGPAAAPAGGVGAKHSP
jgi:uncharacterized protein (DUF697 family)